MLRYWQSGAAGALHALRIARPSCACLLVHIAPAHLLACRCLPPSARLRSLPRGYPSEELGLRLADAEGLGEAQVRALSKALHQAAAEYVRAGEICCFQLVNQAQVRAAV